MDIGKLKKYSDLAFDIKQLKQNALEKSDEILSVETKAQLLSAANNFFYSVMAVPIAQSPRPGGKNFMLKIRSYIS